MPRKVDKGPGYHRAMQREAGKAAFAGFWVLLGLWGTAMSLFSLLARQFGLSLSFPTLEMLEFYRGLVYPVLDWFFGWFGLRLAVQVHDLVALYLLVGGVISRPLKAIYGRAIMTDAECGSVFSVLWSRPGWRLDRLFCWALDERYNTVTFWRRPLFRLGSIVLLPATIWLFVRHPYTISAGGVSLYQSASDEPSDNATFNTALFDCRVILELQLSVSLILTCILLLAAVSLA